jgi:hypothetical protein
LARVAGALGAADFGADFPAEFLAAGLADWAGGWAGFADFPPALAGFGAAGFGAFPSPGLAAFPRAGLSGFPAGCSAAAAFAADFAGLRRVAGRPPPLAICSARAARSGSASSSVIVSGALSLGSVALMPSWLT